jgi:hypothetical protein
MAHFLQGWMAPLTQAIQAHLIQLFLMTLIVTIRRMAILPLCSEFFYSHMNKQYPVLGSPSSISYNALQAIGSNTSEEQGLTNDVISIAGAGVPPEKILCIYDDYTKTFTHTADLDRHVLNVHNRVGHHCQVPGCNNNKRKWQLSP